MTGLVSVLEDAAAGLFAGSVEDRSALRQAFDLGFVERVYEGPAGLLGLAKLRLTPAGRVALRGES